MSVPSEQLATDAIILPKRTANVKRIWIKYNRLSVSIRKAVLNSDWEQLKLAISRAGYLMMHMDKIYNTCDKFNSPLNITTPSIISMEDAIPSQATSPNVVEHQDIGPSSTSDTSELTVHELTEPTDKELEVHRMLISSMEPPFNENLFIEAQEKLIELDQLGLIKDEDVPRVKLKFIHDKDKKKAVKLLRKLGLPIKKHWIQEICGRAEDINLKEYTSEYLSNLCCFNNYKLCFQALKHSQYPDLFSCYVGISRNEKEAKILYERVKVMVPSSSSAIQRIEDLLDIELKPDPSMGAADFAAFEVEHYVPTMLETQVYALLPGLYSIEDLSSQH